MEARAKLLGHPIHQMLIVFPLGVLGMSLRPPPEAVAPLPPDLHPNLSTRERVTLQTKAGAVVSLIGPIDTITTPDDKTVILNYKQGYYAFMLQAWRYFFGIMSPKYLATLKPAE